MKNIFLSILSVLFVCTVASGQPISSTKDVADWVDRHFAKGKVPPFSFVYGGKKSDTFITGWQYKAETLSTDEPGTKKMLYSYTDKRTGLVVDCTVTCFDNFPAAEWVVNFRNTSGKNTPLIEQAAIVDQSFAAGEKGIFTLYRNMGSDVNKTDFQPIEEKIQQGTPISIVQTRGRSSDYSALPFFNIEMPGDREIGRAHV